MEKCNNSFPLCVITSVILAYDLFINVVNEIWYKELETFFGFNMLCFFIQIRTLQYFIDLELSF